MRRTLAVRATKFRVKARHEASIITLRRGVFVACKSGTPRVTHCCNSSGGYQTGNEVPPDEEDGVPRERVSLHGRAEGLACYVLQSNALIARTALISHTNCCRCVTLPLRSDCRAALTTLFNGRLLLSARDRQSRSFRPNRELSSSSFTQSY